ncbi:CAMK/RAD53 protein kinase [Magnaporthiopsis poae ATCC 64411]|uniref:CAMK/RAD53 protein kinase n=1 Tax=Magnaporthiopsis poae (strain ATCC 64411 / 73-15) TaxID=644358 RepID=A0A0C4EGS1_MAGP6|nr:CAMK/RAD53 protein kinase [Magnaporthiopsis poae ATCC 64411]
MTLRTPLPGGRESTYGTIFMAFDSRTANTFVIKKIQLGGDEDEKGAHRALCHREVKLLGKLNHPNISECLGCNDFESDAPEILLPLREGTASSLAGELTDFASKDAVCTAMAGQMLAALDYLNSEKVVHRDIKPDNILYMRLPGDHQYQFQLADFGLSHHQSLAKTLETGTLAYIAPELMPHRSRVQASQSSKSGTWSLGAAILAFFGVYPPKANVPRNIAAKLPFLQQLVVDQARPYELLVAMTQMRPERRASAAQLLPLIPEVEPVAQPNATAMPALQQPQTSAGDARSRDAVDPLAERGPFGLLRSRLRRPALQPSRHLVQLGITRPGAVIGALHNEAVQQAVPHQQAVLRQHAVPTQQAVPPPDVGTAAASLSISDTLNTLDNQKKRMWGVLRAFPES